MTELAWRTFSSRIGWFVAATFLIAMVIYALGQFHIIVPEPEFLPAETYVDDLIAGFEHRQAHWIADLTSSLILAAGFVGLAILGATLWRALDGEDVRGAVLAVTFLLAGAIGATSQVLFVGATEVASNPEYCDCGILAEEIISRQMGLDIALSVVFWMTDMSIAVFAIGLLAFASLATASGWVPGGLAVYARVLAGLVVLSVVWGRVVVPLLMEGGVELDYFRIGDLVIMAIAGVLVPIWAAWLARSAGNTPSVSEAEGPPSESTAGSSPG